MILYRKLCFFSNACPFLSGRCGGNPYGSELIEGSHFADAVLGQIAGQFGRHTAFGPIDACQAAQKIQCGGFGGGNLRSRMLHRQGMIEIGSIDLFQGMVGFCFAGMSSRLLHRIFLSFNRSHSPLRFRTKIKNLRHDSRPYIASSFTGPTLHGVYLGEYAGATLLIFRADGAPAVFASLFIKRTDRAFSVCVRNLFFSFCETGRAGRQLSRHSAGLFRGGVG